MLRYNSLLLAVLSGCFSFEFSNPVSANFSATADGSGNTLVRACFGEGFALFCTDASTSEVNASSDGEETRLFPNAFLGVPFEGVLTGDVPGKEITFSWVSRDGLSAPSSVVTLPEAFEILEPAEGSTFLPTDEVRLTWEPSLGGEIMRLDKLISCPGSSSFGPLGEFEDSGEFVIPSSVLQFSPEDDCSVELTLTRVRQGTLDPQFQSFGIEGRQSRVVSFLVSPK